MEIIEAIKKTFNKLAVRSVIISIILIAVAILLITNPERVLTIAVIIAGIALIIDSIVHIVVYMTQSPEIRAVSSEFMIGVIECVVGILFIIYQSKVISVFYVLIGVWLIIQAISKAQMAINLKGYISNWGLTIIVAIIDVILGVLVLKHPYDTGTSITQITGIILVVSESFNLVESIYTLVKVKKIEKVVELNENEDEDE